MSLFEKLGLIERVEEEPIMCEEDLLLEGIKEEINANIEGVSNENLVSDIYNANSLSDVSKSIFKVEELINSLPKEMATDTKRASVLAILTSFGLTSEIVTEDGCSRSNLLAAALDEIVTINNNRIDSCKEEVESHKKAIENLEKYIADLENENKVCSSKILEEVDRITKLVDFVTGGN